MKTLINLIDLLSFAVLIFMMSSGAVLEFTLPARSGPASVWGLSRHEWGDLHGYLSLAFLLLMAVHLMLHVRYIKSALMGKASREQNYRLAIGLIGLLSLLALALAPPLSPVDETARGGRGFHGRQMP